MLSREFNLKLAAFIPFLLALSLPYGNLTKLLGIEDGFSRISFSIILILYIIFLSQKNNLIIKLNPLIIVMLASFFVTVVQVVIGNINLYTALNYFIKICLFVIIFTFTENRFAAVKYFFIKYKNIFLLSLPISLLMWLAHPVPEFVIYDGSDRRFAGLHFELFNFVYSLCLFYLSWTLTTRFKFLALVIVIILGVMSKSNIFMIFSLLVLMRGLLGKLLQNYVAAFGFVFSIVLSPLIIGFFLHHFEFLTVLSLRQQTSFDETGSSLYVRLYPYSLAAQLMIENGFIQSLFPHGLGSFESSDLVKNDKLSFGGTGSPKAFIDLGIILIFSLCFYVAKMVYRSAISKPELAAQTALVFGASLVFISYGAGFFNTVAWFAMISWHSAMVNTK